MPRPLNMTDIETVMDKKVRNLMNNTILSDMDRKPGGVN